MYNRSTNGFFLLHFDELFLWKKILCTAIVNYGIFEEYEKQMIRLKKKDYTVYSEASGIHL